MNHVFVYGTLKQGFANFHVNGGQRVPGRFVTVPSGAAAKQCHGQRQRQHASSFRQPTVERHEGGCTRTARHVQRIGEIEAALARVGRRQHRIAVF